MKAVWGQVQLARGLAGSSAAEKVSSKLSIFDLHPQTYNSPATALMHSRAVPIMSVDMDSDREQQKKQKKAKRKTLKDEQEAAPANEMDIDEAPESSKKDKKQKSKDKKRKERTQDIEAEVAPTELDASPKRRSRHHKTEDKKNKKQKRASPPVTTSSATLVPEDRQYPFFTQTFSQRIPVWPAAFDEPLTKIAKEYLEPQLNRYSPKFKGVLLAYKNVNLSDRPQRANPKNPPTDDTPVTLQSFECYAPPFAWLTADLHLFVPSRGAWMEGEINLQSEGHVGVVCFEKFNASISRRSLPKAWNWVEQEEEAEVEEDPFQEKTVAGEADGTQEGGEGQEDGETAPRLRSTGYYVDEHGDKIDGKIYFRIKNFSSGSTGDYTYLSLQGTMLDEEAEKESAAEERAIEKARREKQNPTGLLYPTMRIPESSMTKLN